MSPKDGSEHLLQVIGIETPGSSAEVLGTRPIVIRLPETVPERVDWCYWRNPETALRPTWPEFAEMFFANGRVLELSANKPYRAFRVQTDYLVKLIGGAEVCEDNILTHLPPDLVEGYAYDPGLRAIYRIFEDATIADRERGKWAKFVEGIMRSVLSGTPNWERFDVVLECLMSVSSSEYTPETRYQWLALCLASCRIRRHRTLKTIMNLFIDREYPEGHPERAHILAEAQRYEEELRARWIEWYYYDRGRVPLFPDSRLVSLDVVVAQQVLTSERVAALVSAGEELLSDQVAVPRAELTPEELERLRGQGALCAVFEADGQKLIPLVDFYVYAGDLAPTIRAYLSGKAVETEGSTSERLRFRVSRGGGEAALRLANEVKEKMGVNACPNFLRI